MKLSSLLFVGMILAMLAAYFSIPANAQAQRPPTREQFEKENCTPLYSLPANIDITPLMTDNDGDKWIRVRVIGTGRVLVGYVKRNALFCTLGEGKTNPET